MRRAPVALFVATLFVAACSQTSTVFTTIPSDQATQASASATVTATATPTADAPHVLWTEQAFDGYVAAVIADGARLVAVGGDPSGRAAWSGGDDLSWEQHDVPDPAPTDCAEFYDPVCFPNTAGMGQLARLGDTLYSIGTTESFNDYLRPVGWLLTDGEAWQAIHSESAFYEFGWLRDLTASNTALLAVKFGPTNFTSNAWRWTFDTSWVATQLAGSTESPIELIDSTWGRGTYVAVGSTAELIEDVGPDRWPISAAMWLSDDGLNWAAIEPPPGAVSLCSVTATTNLFIALGTTDVGPAIWASADTASWQRSDLAWPVDVAPDTNSPFTECGVTELDGGLLATRSVNQGTLTWTSTDASRWEAGPTLDVITTPDLVAALGGTVVLFGKRGQPTGDSTTVSTSVFLVGTVER